MRVCVCYAGDTNVVRCAGISMISLFENNKDIEEIEVYFIEDQITKEDFRNLQDIADGFQRKLNFLSSSEIIGEINIYDSKFPQSAFSRLFIENINEDKILYLDCDTLVTGSLKTLYQIDMQDKYFAAVQDVVCKEVRDKIGLSEEDKYINAGVLLINVQKLREVGFSQLAVDYIEKYYNEYGGMVAHNDQGVINSVAREHILVIDPSYNMTSIILLYKPTDIPQIFQIHNFYGEKMVEQAKKNPVILHFVEGVYGRPWQDYCTHPYRNLYREYLNKSVWKNVYDRSNLLFRRKLDGYLYKILPVKLYTMIKSGYRKTKKKGIKS